MNDERLCGFCGEPIPATARGDARYCKTACRQSASKQRVRRERAQLVVEHQPARDQTDQLAKLNAALDVALAEPRLVATIAAAARANWRAAAWLLERQHPERWSPRGKNEEPHDVLDGDDPFREVDELAARRQRPHV